MSENLTEKSIRSIGWTSLASIVAKAIGFVSQLVFARLLAPDAFGLFALATSIAAVLTVIQQGGIAQVLISRPRRIDRLLSYATTTSLALGAVVSALVIAMGPSMAVWFDEPRLTRVLPCFAISILFASFGSPAVAYLQARFEFRGVAILDVTSAVTRAVLSVGFALAGLGAYSLVIPVPIVSAVAAFVGWRMTGVRPTLGFSRRRAWRLFAAGVPLAAAQLVLLATWHGDYIIVQSMLDTDTLGVYFLAFTLATQFFALASVSASRVLFSGLSQLSSEPERQTKAFFKAASELAAFAFPISFLQVLLAEPAVEFLFPARFSGMAAIIAILSVGLAFRCVGSPAGALLQARRRFWRLLTINSIYSAFFLTFVYAGTRFYAELGTAYAVTCYFVLLGPVHILVSVPSVRQSVADVFRLFLGPTTCSIVALVCGWYCQSSLQSILHPVLAAVCGSVAFVAVYWLIARSLFPGVLVPLVTRGTSATKWVLKVLAVSRSATGAKS